MTEGFFANSLEEGRGGVVRVGGRAMLVPAGISPSSGIRVPYTSASSLADYISDDSFLSRWEKRYLCVSMGRHRDLQRLAASEPYHTGLDALDWREKKDSAYRIDQIIERALDRQLIHEKADYGTAFHQHTEPGAPPVPPEDEELTRDVDSFWAKLKAECVNILETEQFIANDEVMGAGTYDHGVRILGHPDLEGYVVADKKTGRIDPFHWEIQIAVYANGEIYDRDTHTRQQISSDINTDYGVVFHTKNGVTTFHVLDLQRGWANARLAAQVRDAREDSAKVMEYQSATFTQRLEACRTVEDARRLWRSLPEGPERNRVTDRALELS